jgi:dihydroorotate dehydrogenase electron transfer subunit
MIRPAGGTDPLLARPLALYDTQDDANGEPVDVDVVYLVMGAGTRALSLLSAGHEVVVWGPLGNTFPTPAVADLSRPLIIAGGIGQTPFVAMIREWLGQRRYGGRVLPGPRPQSIRFLWGTRSAAQLAGINDFRQLGVDVQVATEDGSAGFRGRVTDLADAVVPESDPPSAVLSCGPEPMLKAVAQWAHRRRVPAWVSLETKMACGYGVCFSCVCPVVDADQPAGWDYRRVCTEGPVFPAEAIAWEA